MNFVIKKLLKFGFVFLFIWLANTTFAQKFNEQIDFYTEQFPHERMYFQYDKSIYNAGETIWFKVYLRSGIARTNFSKNLYIDFSDENGKVLAHSMFPIGESSSRGQFDIPKDFSGTVIQVKAYTKWMLNFDTAFLYKKIIKVIPKGNANVFARVQKSNVTVTLFPEGGELVNGIDGKVAFLATDQFGKPVDISGEVVNNSGAKIADINTIYNGMGTFALKPNSAENYSFKWRAIEGNDGTIALPQIKSQGVTLAISPRGNNAAYKIERTSGAEDASKRVTLIGMMYNRLVYMANINLSEKNVLEGIVPFNDLPTGILQLSVVDANKMPLAERIVFVKTDDYSFLAEVGLTKIGFGKREENELSVHLPGENVANLSVSVTDADINYNATENIYSGLLLSSQIKGRVYNPSYYFSDNTPEVNSRLDLVMLTHGWRKYNWKNIADGIKPEIKYEPDSTYLTFGGKVYATPQQIAAGGDIITILKMKGDTAKGAGNFLSIPINSDGTFNDKNISFMDSLSIYYTFSNKNSPLRYSEVRFLENKLSSPTKIIMNQNDVLATKSLDSSGFGRSKYFSTLQFTELEEGQLKDVIVSANTKSELQKLDERYTSGLFKGDGYQFDLLNDNLALGAQNIFQYLQSRVPGLQINNAMSGEPSLSWRGSAPSLFLDEMPIDAQFLTNLNVNDIAYVKVFRPPFFGAAGGGAGGGIAVYTRRGGDVSSAQQSGTGIPSKTIEGYTVIKEFYAPNYLFIDEKYEKPDLRSTIYWNPFILLDKNNKTAKFKFFNNDVTKSFRIVLEGVNSEGQLIHLEKIVK